MSARNRSKLPEMHPICMQFHFQVLSGVLLKISGEFGKGRNSPISSKKPGLQPMVLNMADLGEC